MGQHGKSAISLKVELQIHLKGSWHMDTMLDILLQENAEDDWLMAVLTLQNFEIDLKHFLFDAISPWNTSAMEACRLAEGNVSLQECSV